MQTACPKCGAPVEFRYDDSFVRICDYCHVAVLRRDREVESLGKVSDLTETPSALALYARGSFRGTGFDVVGHVEIEHERGGRFHEWYARFDDGRWGWLAEAQGRYYLTFRAAGPVHVPELEFKVPGDLVTIYDGQVPLTFKLAERASATPAGAEGELPFAFVPGKPYRFADLGGRDQFATIDFGSDDGDRPELYLGEQLALRALDLKLPSGEPARPPAIRSRKLDCPGCGGSLEQWVPGQSLRLTCLYCNKLLDVEHPPFKVIADLIDGVKRSPIPLGSTCRFEGHELTVVGYLERAIAIDDDWYPFDEFLLFAPELGFRWLVQSDGHYSYVRPIAPGLVDGFRAPHYDGVKFRAFSAGNVRVRRVLGEFYWRVALDDLTEMRDYVAPGALLTRESDSHEENWTLGTYLTHAEVRAAFSIPLELPPPVGIAPHQPGLPGLREFVKVGAWATLAVVVLFLLLSVAKVQRVVLHAWVEWPSAPDPNTGSFDATAPVGPVWFSDPFELAAHEAVELRFRTVLDNSWQWIQADLVDVDHGNVVTVAQDIEYYHGVEGGEAWSEGSPTAQAILEAHPAGHYVLRLETEAPLGSPPRPFDLEVVQGVMPTRLLVYALLLVAVPLAGIGLYIHRVERRRWENSNLVHEPQGDD